MLLTLIASLCTGIAVFCAFLLFSHLLGRIETSSEGPENAEQEGIQRLPILFRMFLPLSGNLSGLIRKDAAGNARKHTAEMLQNAGCDQVLTVEQYLGIRILTGIFGLLVMILAFLADQGVGGILIFLLLLIYPDSWLRKTIKQRHLAILKALPNLLDLLTLSVEAGKDFLTALRDILARRAPDILGNELKRALHEIQLGKSRQAALHELAERINQPELTSVLNAIIQADEMGVGIGQLLRIQGDQLRHKRFARAETMANEAPVKILFPVILFIFPSVFIILIAPIVSQAMKSISL